MKINPIDTENRIVSFVVSSETTEEIIPEWMENSFFTILETSIQNWLLRKKGTYTLIREWYVKEDKGAVMFTPYAEVLHHELCDLVAIFGPSIIKFIDDYVAIKYNRGIQFLISPYLPISVHPSEPLSFGD